MKSFIIIVIILFAGYLGYQNWGQSEVETNDPVIVYSLSYCGFCQNLSQELSDSGIGFVEYYVDTNESKRDELTQKLMAHNIPGGSIKMPVVDLGDILLPNRPSLSEIEIYFE